MFVVHEAGRVVCLCFSEEDTDAICAAVPAWRSATLLAFPDATSFFTLVVQPTSIEARTTSNGSLRHQGRS